MQQPESASKKTSAQAGNLALSFFSAEDRAVAPLVSAETFLSPTPEEVTEPVGVTHPPVGPNIPASLREAELPMQSPITSERDLDDVYSYTDSSTKPLSIPDNKQIVESYQIPDPLSDPSLNSSNVKPTEEAGLQEKDHASTSLGVDPSNTSQQKPLEEHSSLHVQKLGWNPSLHSKLEDVETSSVMSIDQLAESLKDVGLEMPSSLQDHSEQLETSSVPSRSSSRDDKSVSSALQPVAAVRMPSHIKIPQQSPKHVIQTAPSGSGSHSPASASTPRGKLLQFPTFARGPGIGYPISDSELLLLPAVSPLGGGAAEMKPEEDQVSVLLARAVQAKVNLEAQLEAVVSECKTALKDRAELQSKLARKEAEKMARPLSSLEHQEVAQVKQDLKEIESSLRKEKKAASVLKDELSKEKRGNQKLQNLLSDSQQRQKKLDSTVDELRRKVSGLQEHLTQRDDEMNELGCKLAALEGSLQAGEDSKTWLHQQLQEALETKKKMQEDLREARTAKAAQSLKSDQLMKENSIFQQQIADLQKGVLQDKAKLVDELEAIEADVMMKEDSYAQLTARNKQVEDVLQLRDKDMEDMNSKLAKAQVEIEELAGQLEQSHEDKIALGHKVESLKTEKEDLVTELARQVEEEQSRVRALQKQKAALQERIQQSESAIMNKEGTLQGLKDAKDILKQESAMVKQARDTAEKELEEMNKRVAELESEFKALNNQNKEKEAKIKSLMKAKQMSAAGSLALQEKLMEKEKELQQKSAELQDLESQSKELVTAFQSLEDRFHSMSEPPCEEKSDDKSVHLEAEKEQALEQLKGVQDLSQQLQKKIDALECSKAELEGKLESFSSSNLEGLKKAIQDKAMLQGELDSIKIGLQEEAMKSHSRAKQLESELRKAKEDAARNEETYLNTLNSKDGELDRLEKVLMQAESELAAQSDKFHEALLSKQSAEDDLRTLQAQVDSLGDRNDLLTKKNQELQNQLQHELAHKSEVERASGMVAMKLKENAEEKERELQEQVQSLSLEVERLRGRLAGINTAQSCVRDHAGALELALANKESSLVKVSAQAQKILQEKDQEDLTHQWLVSELRGKVEALEKVLEDARNETTEEKARAENLHEELSKLKVYDAESAEVLRMRAEHLSQEKHALESELRVVKSQLMVTKADNDRAKGDLANKASQLQVMESELDISRVQASELTEESSHLKDMLRLAEERHRAEMEDLRRAMSESSILEGSSKPVLGARVSGGGTRRMFDTSFSSLGLEDTDGHGEYCVCSDAICNQ